MLSRLEVQEALQEFVENGWICDLLFEIKSGKEATVYCCRPGERVKDLPLIAAKIYRPLERRSFRNDSMYQAGRVHLARDSRFKRAVENKSAFGLKVQYGAWLQNEWETMRLLHAAHADVPKPLISGERAILMPYFGDENGAAPNLHQADLSRDDTERIVDRLLWNIELMLDCDRVHGDLSPFNVLLHEQQPLIIDFPQAIDPRLNPAGAMLLRRDVASVCDWAARHGLHRKAERIASDLWSRFVLGEIG